MPAEVTATILAVDDSSTHLELLGRCLRDRYQVITADSGESALGVAEREQPDLILLDVMMPGIDGFETCRRLKADPRTREIPVIFMTGLEDIGEIEDKGADLYTGAVDFVSKPFRRQEVLVRVENHIELRRLQRDLRARNRALEDEVAQRRHAEETLQQHIAKLEDNNAELDAFARTVAHDLREPLTAIIGFSQLVLEEKRLSSRVQESVEYILRTGYRMSNITRELLLLARMRDVDIELAPIEMAKVVHDSCDRLSLSIDDARATITVAEDWPVGLGYGPWLEEVWVNYLSNAIKYGGKPPRIEVGAMLEDRSGDPGQRRAPTGNPTSAPESTDDEVHVRYWVRDNGPGIAEDDLGLLFTEFTRLDRIRARGHGLGLSIVRRIVEKLGGRVGVDSRLGEGSTFFFTLRATDLPIPVPKTPTVTVIGPARSFSGRGE